MTVIVMQVYQHLCVFSSFRFAFVPFVCVIVFCFLLISSRFSSLSPRLIQCETKGASIRNNCITNEGIDFRNGSSSVQRFRQGNGRLCCWVSGEHSRQVKQKICFFFPAVSYSFIQNQLIKCN